MELFSVFATIGLDDSKFKEGINKAEKTGLRFADTMSWMSNSVSSGMSKMSVSVENASTRFAQSINGISEAISKNENAFMIMGSSLVENVILGIEKTLPRLKNTVIQGFGSVVDDLFESLAVVNPKLKQAFDFDSAEVLSQMENTGESLATELVNAFANYDKLISLGDDVINRLVDSLADGEDLLIELGYSLANGFSEALKGNETTGLFASIGPNGWIFKGIVKLGMVAVDNSEQVGAFFSNMGERARESFPKVMDAVDGTTARIGVFVAGMRETGAEMVENFRNGFESRKAVGFGVVDNFAGDVLSQMTDRLSDIWGVATNTMDSFINGFSSRKDDGFNLMRNFVDDMLNTARNSFVDMREIGTNMMDGLVDGINGAASRVVESVQNVTSRAVNGARNFLGINSPSRVFADMGKASIDGYIMGLESENDSLNKTINNLFDVGKKSSEIGTITGVVASSTSYQNQGNNPVQNIHLATGAITIDAKNIKDFNSIVELFSDYSYNNRVYNGV